MILDKLYLKNGSKKKRKRRGRGVGSGHGKTSCRGNKGLFSRSGGKLRHGFEGGQMPLIRRIPKRGFTGRKHAVYQVVNLDIVSAIKDKEVISPEDLKEYGYIRYADRPVKILGKGEILKSITLKAHAFSSGAKEKVEKAGGKAEIIKTITAEDPEKKKPGKKVKE